MRALCWMSATQLARLVRLRQVTAAEVVQAYLE